VIGLTLAFCSGAMIAAVAHDLVLDAFAGESFRPWLGLAAGA
jgi:hypothetical protein